MRYLWVPLLPLIMLSTKAVVEPSSLGNDVVGQALTLALLGLAAYLVFPISRARIKGEASMQQSITAIALALAPVALMVLVGLGYYYTALKLTGRLIESFYLIIIWAWSTAPPCAGWSWRPVVWPIAVRWPSASTSHRKMREGVSPSKSSPWIWRMSASSPCA